MEMDKNTQIQNGATGLLANDDVQVHQINTRYQGFFKIDEYHLSHKLFNGGHSDIVVREVLERGDAVVLLPYDPVKDTVVLLEQFRPGVIRSGESPWLLELVAGMFDEGESAEAVAIREAKEEANLDISEQTLYKIMKSYLSPGGTSECIYLYGAHIDSTNVGGIYGLPEEGEDILVHVLPREKVMALLSDGKITNASAVLGLQWLELNYQRLQKEWLAIHEKCGS